MTKPERLDCVAEKRRAQRAVAKALAGKPIDEQAQILHRLAAQTSLWKELAKARATRPSQSARRKRRSPG